MTNDVDPLAPHTLREHGGSLWHKGRGPQRHEQDPSRRGVAAD
jgi:hypothetical protein